MVEDEVRFTCAVARCILESLIPPQNKCGAATKCKGPEEIRPQMVAGAIAVAFANWENGIRSDQPFFLVLAKGSMVYVHEMIITVHVR